MRGLPWSFRHASSPLAATCAFVAAPAFLLGMLGGMTVSVLVLKKMQKPQSPKG